MKSDTQLYLRVEGVATIAEIKAVLTEALRLAESGPCDEILLNGAAHVSIRTIDRK